jgi:hypothetical protein
MPVVAGTPTIIINNFNVFEAIVPLTLSGSYPGTAAGDPLDLTGIVPSNSVPIFADVKEIQPAGTATSGVKWDFAVGTTQANGALLAQISAGFTPAGTVAKPSFTVKNGTILANGTMGLDADAASANVVGGTGITADRTLTTSSPVGTPAFTGTAVAAAVQTGLGNVTYASVSASHLVMRVVFKKFV